MDDLTYIVRRRCVGVFVALAFYVVLAGLFLIFVKGDAGSYAGLGFVYLCCGAVFAFAGVYIWRLFYAHEDEGSQDYHLLGFLSRAAMQRQQRRAVELSFFPDRFVIGALWGAVLFGVYGVFDMVRSSDGIFIVHDFMLRSGSFLVAILFFFAAQGLAQMFARAGIFVAGALVLFCGGVFVIDGGYAVSLGMGAANIIFGAVCGLLALRFVRAFRVSFGIYSVFGLVVLGGLFVFYGAASFSFMWAGFGLVGALSGAVYRPRDKEYRLYQV